MQELKEVTSAVSSRSEAAPDLLTQYGCGPIRFSGHNDALYERHLLFDDIIAPATAGARERFEAVARSVRDYFRSVGSSRIAPTPGKTQSASTICRWSF